MQAAPCVPPIDILAAFAACSGAISLMNNTIANQSPSRLPLGDTVAQLAVLDVDVPENLNFDDDDAVDREYERLLGSPALASFCERVFDSRDPAGSLEALISLILYRCAHESRQSTGAIGQHRKVALMTVTEHLSPVGQDELLQSLDANAAPRAFQRYLTEADRLCLASHIYSQRAQSGHDSEDLIRSAEASTGAAQAYLLMDETTRAVESCCAASKAYEAAGLIGKAIDAQTKAADIAKQANSFKMAVENYAKLARRCTAWADALRETGSLEQAEHAQNRATVAYGNLADVYCMRADECLQRGQHEEALSLYSEAKNACRQGKYPVRAAQLCEKVANLYLDRGKPESAARHYAYAAQDYCEGGEHEWGRQAYAKATDIRLEKQSSHVLRDIFQLVAAVGAATVGLGPERHLHVVTACLAAARASMRIYEEGADEMPLTIAKENYQKAVAARDAAATTELLSNIEKAFVKFADDCTVAGYHALALPAYMQEIEACVNAVGLGPERHLREVTARLAAMQAHIRGHNQPDWSHVEYGDVEHAEINYQKALDILRAAQQAGPDAAGTTQRVADIKKAFLNFADDCMVAGGPAPIDSAYSAAWAGAAYRDMGRTKQAVAAFGRAARLYQEVRKYKDAAQSWREAADCEMAAGSCARAAKFFMDAARAYMLEKGCETAAGEMWERAAAAWAMESRDDDARGALENANKVYKSASLPEVDRKYWGRELTLHREAEGAGTLTDPTDPGPPQFGEKALTRQGAAETDN